MGRGKPAGIETRAGFVSWNSNTGVSAISLAYHLGVRTIVLLGFDMKNDADGNSNYHDDHVSLELRKAANRQEV